jgi:uncharacterized membrane protein
MKRILGIAAVAGLLAAAPAFAGVDVFVQFGTPAPVYTVPAPVYVAPAAYYGHDPRWFERRQHFDRHFHHDRRDFRDHRWHHDYRNRH